MSSLFTEAMKTTDLGNNQSLYNAEKEHKLSNNIPGTSDVEGMLIITLDSAASNFLIKLFCNLI